MSILNLDNMKLPAYDKLLHYIAGTYIYLTLAIFVHPVIALVGVALVGLFKEVIWDGHLGKGCFEVKDFFYTFAGGVLSMILTIF